MPDTHTRTQHTPGPWEIRGDTLYGPMSYGRDDGKMRIVARVTGLDWYANARLIEAAPDLLAACELMEQAETNADAAQAWLAIRAAIRKARGEE